MTKDKNKTSLKKIFDDVKKDVKENIYEKEIDKKTIQGIKDWSVVIGIIVGFFVFSMILIKIF